MGEASSGSFLFLFLKERDGKREGTCFLAHREWGNTVFLGKYCFPWENYKRKAMVGQSV